MKCHTFSADMKGFIVTAPLIGYKFAEAKKGCFILTTATASILSTTPPASPIRAISLMLQEKLCQELD